MDNYQKVEQLVNKMGCSYEDAKAALESCGWDMLDAVINLERDGKVKKETTEPKAEEPVEITPEVSYDEGSAGNKEDEGKSQKAEGGAKRKGSLWNRIKRIVMNNRMLIIKGNGQQIVNVPILVPVIALIAFFWGTLILAGLAMIFGFRFHFEGEDLGKTGINNTMDKATDYAEKVKNDLAGKVNDRQNTDN